MLGASRDAGPSKVDGAVKEKEAAGDAAFDISCADCDAESTGAARKENEFDGADSSGVMALAVVDCTVS